MSEEYIKLLVEKIDKIQNGVSDVEKRVAIIDQKFEDHEDYTQRILADIKQLKDEASELRGRVKTLEELKVGVSFFTKAVPYVISAGGAIVGAIAAYYGLR